MWLNIQVLLLFGTCLLNSVNSGRYSGNRVVRVTPNLGESTNILESLLTNSTNLDIWRFPSKHDRSVDIRLSDEEFSGTVSILKSNGYDVKILINDLQQLIDQQETERYRLDDSTPEFKYSRYHDLQQINKWLVNKTKVYKDRSSLVKVATSYEGRPLRALKIKTNTSSTIKPAIWIQGGIHAREWISTATVLYIMGKMLDNYQLDRKLKKVVDKFEWYFLPVTNPDGYLYSWTRDRMWRKSRSPHSCIGVDLNRNWDAHWYGSSSYSCSSTYRGPKPFSEPETKGIANYIKNKIPKVKAFLDLHSYSQYWLSPWGYTDDLPPDFKQQDKGSKLAVDALRKVHGTIYRHGNIASLMIFPISGSSTDWAYDKAGIKYSYGVELRDTGRFGFLLPENQIIPTAEEFLQGLFAIAEYIGNN